MCADRFAPRNPRPSTMQDLGYGLPREDTHMPSMPPELEYRGPPRDEPLDRLKLAPVQPKEPSRAGLLIAGCCLLGAGVLIPLVEFGSSLLLAVPDAALVVGGFACICRWSRS